MNLEELMASAPPMQQHALIKGFQAGAASRDDEIAFLITRLSNRLTNLVKCEEERDQLRNQVAMLRHALIHTCSHTRIDSGFDRDLVDNALSETEPK